MEVKQDYDINAILEILQPILLWFSSRKTTIRPSENLSDTSKKPGKDVLQQKAVK